MPPPSPVRGGDVALGLAGTIAVPVLLIVAIINWPYPTNISAGRVILGAAFVEGIGVALLSVLAYRVKRPGFAIGMIIGGGLAFLFMSACGSLLISFGI